MAKIDYPFRITWTHVTQAGKRGLPVVACDGAVSADLRFTSWASCKELVNTLQGIINGRERALKARRKERRGLLRKRQC